MGWLRIFRQGKPQQQSDPTVKFLVAGLGNYDIEYLHTRHNIGFDILDFIAGEKKISFASARYAETAEFRLKGRSVRLIKPTTFMNLSGKAVKYWLDKEKIPLENLLVVLDDLNLPLGKIRMRRNGSDGGHNGLKNIRELLQSEQYARLRFGIGNAYHRGGQANYVLGQWDKEDEAVLKERIPVAAKAVLAFILEGTDRAMSLYNSK